jgi:rhodanese-related sulfurtransferase
MKLLLSLLGIALSSSPTLVADPAKPAPTDKKARVQDVSPDEAQRLIKESPGLIVIDVRTADEFAEGHIKGAKNIDIFESDFASKIAALDASKPVLVHCASGHRSAEAVGKMKVSTKFPAIYHLKAGFSGWKAAKKPIETK